MAVKFQLTARQIEGIRERFGETVDLKKEFVRARQYVEAIHTGRPYKNLGLMFWHWCLRVERWDGSGRRQPAVRAAELCSKCGRKRTAVLAPNPGSATLCGWCGHDEKSTRTGNRDVA